MDHKSNGGGWTMMLMMVICCVAMIGILLLFGAGIWSQR